MREKIFVAVAWPYANGELHLGHFAGSMLAPDIFARFQRLAGNDVLMISGTDMHGSPTEVAAQKEGVEPSVIAGRNHRDHVRNIKDLNLSFNLYTSTDTRNHKEITQKLFLDLYLKKFLVRKKTKQYWSEKEKKFLLDRFIEGKCPYCGYESARGDQCDSCGKTLEPLELKNPSSLSGETDLIIKDSEDLFLDLPSFENDLKEWLEANTNVKNWRPNVIGFARSWLKEGLKMRPMTRDLSYGVEIPKEVQLKGKENKVIYVWFDGVTGYWSGAVEWSRRISGSYKGEEDSIVLAKFKGQSGDWKDYWMNKKAKHYYFMGKDNIVFHTIIWPAMLIGWNKGRKESEKMQLAYDVPANAFLNLEGRKMSKSKKWFVSLRYLLDKYGIDLLRFYFSLRMPENKDTDFRWKEFIDVNNNELVANLGNFIHRTLSFLYANFEGKVPEGKIDNEVHFEIRQAFANAEKDFTQVKVVKGLEKMMKLSDFGNRYFDKGEVWTVIKKDKKEAGNLIYNCLQVINALRVLIYPVIPNASDRLSKILGLNSVAECISVGIDCWKFEKIEAGHLINKPEPLFKKLDTKVIEEEKNKLGK